MAKTSNLYGVFFPPDKSTTRASWKWGMTWDRSVAVAKAKEVGGMVRVLPDQSDDGQCWDAPTFWGASRPLE